MRVLFLGFALPNADFARFLETDGGMPIQTQRFGRSVIEAMISADIRVTIVSAAPATDYPRNPRLVFRGYDFADGEVEGSAIPFVNVTGLKHITRYAAAWRGGQRAAKLVPPDAVVIHGVHSPFIWCGVHLGRRLGIPIVVILTDPPSQASSYDSRLSGALKRVDRRLIEGGLRRVDGVIALTASLAADFAPEARCLLMEGIAKRLDGGRGQRAATPAEPKRVVYAGGLLEGYGVLTLLRSVSLSKGDWRLYIYGRGPLESAVASTAASDPRVQFGGMANASELASAYANADLLVNPRPSSAEFTLHSFPSKLLEYLAAGRPVLSTRLPGIPPEYDRYVYWTDSDATSLAESIDCILDQPREVLAARGAAGMGFALSSRGPAAQGRRIHDFLTSLMR